MYSKNNLLRFLYFMLIVPASMPSSLFAADDYDDIDFCLTGDIVDIQDIQQTTCTDMEVLNLIETFIQDFDGLCILKQDFYLHTNELNQRSLLDYGLFLPDKFYAHPWHIGGHFFFNQTTRDNFTRKSTAICSYLAIFNETLLQEIQKRIMAIDQNAPVDLPGILPLFANATVQERRTGFMLHGMRRWGDYRFRFLFPFYYIESNLFLTPEEIDDIQAELGISDPTDDMKFARNNLIADKVGFGDLRLNFDFPLSASPNMTTKLGVQVTVPTAFALKSGLYGSTFKKRCRGPVLDFCEIFRQIAANDIPALEATAQAFGQAALEQFNANLIEIPLGNGGHFGLGMYMRSKTPLNALISRPWADNVSIRSRMSLEYLFPRRQDRNFIACGNAGFDALGLNRSASVIINEAQNDPVYAREVLAFLETRFTDNIFPFSLSTRVRPGLIFRWMTKYMHESDTDWGWYLGTDNWLTTKEKLSDICIPKNFPQSLNLKIAQKPFAYQFGVLGSLFWKRPHNLLVALNGQYNFGSVGIGDDFLLSISIEKTF